MNRYQVWYEPYGLAGESDFICIEAENEKEARRIAGAWGWVEEVIKVD